MISFMPSVRRSFDPGDYSVSIVLREAILHLGHSVFETLRRGHRIGEPGMVEGDNDRRVCHSNG